MIRAIARAWTLHQARVRTRREAELRTFIAKVVADCFDETRQARRLARWSSYLNTGAIH